LVIQKQKWVLTVLLATFRWAFRKDGAGKFFCDALSGPGLQSTVENAVESMWLKESGSVPRKPLDTRSITPQEDVMTADMS
jgi:hypothetical protein